jgi:hypothetical protein
MSRTNYLSTILTLAGKDWRLFWADRRAAVLCFLVPIALASAFGMIFHRPTADSTASNVCLPVLIVVEDDGPFTAQVAVDLLNSTRLETKTATRSDALAAVTNHRPGRVLNASRTGNRAKPTGRRSRSCTTLPLARNGSWLKEWFLKSS